MISGFTREHLTPGAFRTRILDVIRVKGKSEAVRVYEVLGEASEALDDETEAYAGAYESAFEAYLARDFDGARRGFAEALAVRPDDPASRDMLERMEGLDPESLPEGWDGSVALTSK
jgi:adenylate cyclase